MMKNCLGLVALITALAAGHAAAAVTVFSDDFEDGNRNGWYLTNQDGTGYYTAEIENASPLLNGPANNELRAMLANPGDPNGNDFVYSVSASFDEVKLVEAGDYIELSMQALSTGHRAVRTGFRIGLYNDMGTTVTADGNHGNNSSIVSSTGDIGDDGGVWAGVSISNTPQAWSAELRNGWAAPWPLWRFNDGTQFAVDPTYNSLLINSDVEYTYTLRITRNGDGDLDVVIYNNEYPGDPTALLGGTLTGVDPNDYIFNTIYLGLYHRLGDVVGTQDVRYDNILVTTNIPTPAAGVAGLIGLALLASRRRGH